MCRCSKNQTFDIRRNPCTYTNWIRNHTGFTADLHGQGGMGSVVDALVKAVEKHGGEVCTKLRVDEVPLHIAPDIFVKDEGVVYTCISTYIVWERLAKTSPVILLLLVVWCLTNTHPERKCMQNIILLRVCPWMRQEWKAWSDRFSICMDLPQVPSCQRSIANFICNIIWQLLTSYDQIQPAFRHLWGAFGRFYRRRNSMSGKPNRLREIRNELFFTMAL